MKSVGIIIWIIVTTVFYVCIKEPIPIRASSNGNKDEIKIQLQGLLFHKEDVCPDYDIWFKADQNQTVRLNQGMYFMSDLPFGIYEIILMNDNCMRATGKIQFIYEKDCKLSTSLQENCNQIFIGDLTKSVRLDLYIDLRGKICINSLEYVQGGVRDLRKRLDPNNIMMDLFVMFAILIAIYWFVKKTPYTFEISRMSGKE